MAHLPLSLITFSCLLCTRSEKPPPPGAQLRDHIVDKVRSVVYFHCWRLLLIASWPLCLLGAAEALLR